MMFPDRLLDDAARGVTDPAEIATKYMLSATVCDAEAETKRHRGENRFCGNTLIDELICEEYGGFFSRTSTRATNGGADVMGAILESPFLSSIYRDCGLGGVYFNAY
jgi:hypothetical protein